MIGIKGNEPHILPWPEIYNSPINEYNTEGLLSMAFPTLFPTGTSLPLQTTRNPVQMHEYALHLLRYHDNRFGKRVRFKYLIYNLMMRHCSQQTTTVFFKTTLHDNIPKTIHLLRESLQNVPDNQLENQLMHFVTSLQGTRAY